MKGFTFNGTHSSTYGIVMKSINRQVLPTSNDTYLQIPGRHGSYLFSGELTDRIIEIECGLTKSTLENLRSGMRDIAAWLYTTDRESLVFDDEPTKTYRAKVEGQIDLEQMFVLGKFTLQFRCEPLAYGAVQTVNFVSDTATVNNTGTFETPPRFSATITITSATTLKVILGTSYIKVDHTFAISDALTIDCGTGSILINGSRAISYLDWQNSEFFNLAVGSNILTISPSGTCSAAVTFSPRWL